MSSPTADNNAPNAPRGLSAVRCSELVSLWHREEASSLKHAAQWESGDNWKGKPDPWMAEVCRMRAETLRLCAMQIEEANKHVSAQSAAQMAAYLPERLLHGELRALPIFPCGGVASGGRDEKRCAE